MADLRAKPTKEMLEWHNYELGVFFHYDIEAVSYTHLSHIYTGAIKRRGEQ